MPRNWNTRAAESARPEVGHDAQPFPHPPTQPGRLNLVFDQRTDAHHFIAQLPVLSFQLKAAPGTQHDIIIEEGHEIRGDPAQSEVSLTGESTQLTHDSEIGQVPVSHAEAIVGAEGAFRLAVRACIHDDHARRHGHLRHERVEQTHKTDRTLVRANRHRNPTSQQVPARGRGRELVAVRSQSQPGADAVQVHRVTERRLCARRPCDVAHYLAPFRQLRLLDLAHPCRSSVPFSRNSSSTRGAIAWYVIGTGHGARTLESCRENRSSTHAIPATSAGSQTTAPSRAPSTAAALSAPATTSVGIPIATVS